MSFPGVPQSWVGVYQSQAGVTPVPPGRVPYSQLGVPQSQAGYLPARTGLGYPSDHRTGVPPPGQDRSGVPTRQDKTGVPPLPGQDRTRGTPSTSRQVTLGQVMLRAVHVLQFPTGGLPCFCSFILLIFAASFAWCEKGHRK